MVNPEHQYTADSDVIYTPLDDGEGVLFHMPTTTYFSLNPTGVRIWELINRGLPLAQVGAELAREYEVTPAQARQSVLRLAADLVDARLLHPHSEGV